MLGRQFSNPRASMHVMGFAALYPSYAGYAGLRKNPVNISPVRNPLANNHLRLLVHRNPDAIIPHSNLVFVCISGHFFKLSQFERIS
jgi:hypothetical protein